MQRIRGSPPFTFRDDEIEFRGLSPAFVPMGRKEMATLFRKAFPVDSLPVELESLEMTINIGFDPIGGGAYKSEGQDDCEIAVLPTDEGDSNGDVIFGLFDGHGSTGCAVSHFCTARYGGILIESDYYFTDPVRALEETTLQLNAELIAEGIDVEMAGTTAVIGLLRKGVLFVANVGDSRAVMGSRRRGMKGVYPLTSDHKADTPSEVSRIVKSGGRCEPMKDQNGNFIGPARVYLLNEERPGLGMSRSLGDSLAHSVGVSAHADVTVTRLTQEDDFFVVGSDGLWDVINNDEVVRMVADKLKWNRKHPEKPVLISEYIAVEAQKRWRELVMREDNVVDDISVIVCVFSHNRPQMNKRRPPMQTRNPQYLPPPDPKSQAQRPGFQARQESTRSIPPPPPPLPSGTMPAQYNDDPTDFDVPPPPRKMVNQARKPKMSLFSKFGNKVRKESFTKQTRRMSPFGKVQRKDSSISSTSKHSKQSGKKTSFVSNGNPPKRPSQNGTLRGPPQRSNGPPQPGRQQPPPGNMRKQPGGGGPPPNQRNQQPQKPGSSYPNTNASRGSPPRTNGPPQPGRPQPPPGNMRKQPGGGGPPPNQRNQQPQKQFGMKPPRPNLPPQSRKPPLNNIPKAKKDFRISDVL